MGASMAAATVAEPVGQMGWAEVEESLVARMVAAAMAAA